MDHTPYMQLYTYIVSRGNSLENVIHSYFKKK